MQKNKLLDIISKYSVSGRCNSVRLVVNDEKQCSIVVRQDVGQYYMSGTFNDFDLQECEVGIFDTESLSKILSAVDNDFQMKLKHERDTPVALELSDSAIDIQFMLADLNLKIFEKPSPQKMYPDTHVSFELDRETMDRFIRSKNAVKDAVIFAVLTDENKIKLIINYSDNPTNHIQMVVDGEVISQISDPIGFNADVVRDIFAANKNASSGKFEVSNVGLLTLTFQGDGWNTKYLVSKLEIG